MGNEEVSTKVSNAEFAIGVAMHQRRYNFSFAEALAEIGKSHRLTVDECAVITKREIAKNKAFWANSQRLDGSVQSNDARQLQLEAHFTRLQA